MAAAGRPPYVGRPFRGANFPVIFQQRIPGATLWDMFDFAALRILPAWQPFKATIASHLSALLDSSLVDHVDWNIKNFVFHGAEQRLDDVDSKPTIYVPGEQRSELERNQDSLRRMTRAAITMYTLLLAITLAAAVIRNDAGTFLDWNLCVVAIAVLALVYSAPRPSNVGRGFSRANSVLVFIAPAYVAFQLLPLPLPLLRLLSPRRAEITDALGTVMPRPWFAPLSVEPAATAVALTTVLACVLCFLLVRELTWRPFDARRG